jgi:endonuclease/exonuclease/phosphatase family metal-dependent hydrolase
MHPQEDGFTLPSTGPRVRLDYVFAALPLGGALSGCRMVTEPAVAASASDHLPVMAEFALQP